MRERSTRCDTQPTASPTEGAGGGVQRRPPPEDVAQSAHAQYEESNTPTKSGTFEGNLSHEERHGQGQYRHTQGNPADTQQRPHDVRNSPPDRT